ncbi:MAG: hypothetical protein SVK08_01580 [Halobacteriota archaeon]|nr:hypothetical protein [Halobacteriota archaeon]
MEDGNGYQKGEKHMNEDVKYTRSGQMVRVISKLDNGKTLVESLIDNRGAIEPSGLYFDVYGLLDEPPVEKFEETIQELSKRIDLLRAEEAMLKKWIRENEVVLKSISDIPNLERIRELVNGEINYIVTVGKNDFALPKIRVAKSIGSSCSIMISMMDGQKKSVEWRLVQSDGTYDRAFLAVSHEEAEDISREIAECAIMEMIRNDIIEEGVVSYSKKYKIDLPEEYMDKIKSKIIHQSKLKIKKLEAELAKAHGDLNRAMDEED